MTPEQIKNWRNVLATEYGLGPYAYIMPEEQIYRIRDRFQANIDQYTEQLESKSKPIVKNGRCQHGVNPKYCKRCG